MLSNIINHVKAFVKAILTPIAFSYRSGHWLSSFLLKAVDSAGKPIPMYTYPAIDLIKSKLNQISNYQILEIGTGQSTLWWLNHVSKVIGIERNELWANYVKAKALENNNDSKLKILSSPSREDFLKILSSFKYEKFDIIIIDGIPYPEGSRYESVEAILEHFNEVSCIIIDNSDLITCKTIIELLNSNDFHQIDFYGYSPGAYKKQCTSFFFKEIKKSIFES